MFLRKFEIQAKNSILHLRYSVSYEAACIHDAAIYFITDSPKRNACRSTQQTSKNNQPARWYVTPLQQSKCVTISKHKTLHYNLLSFNLSASSLSFSQLFIGWLKYNIRLAFLTNVHMRWFGYDKAVLAPEVAMG